MYEGCMSWHLVLALNASLFRTRVQSLEGGATVFIPSLLAQYKTEEVSIISQSAIAAVITLANMTRVSIFVHQQGGYTR